MSWLLRRSSTWRRIVAVTNSSPLYMAGFAVVALGVPAYFGDKVMSSTNSASGGAALESQLRATASIDGRMLAKAQKERLQVMLDEIKAGQGGERYKAALE
jgi:hypothetical protein